MSSFPFSTSTDYRRGLYRIELSSGGYGCLLSPPLSVLAVLVNMLPSPIRRGHLSLPGGQEKCVPKI